MPQPVIRDIQPGPTRRKPGRMFEEVENIVAHQWQFCIRSCVSTSPTEGPVSNRAVAASAVTSTVVCDFSDLQFVMFTRTAAPTAIF